MAINLNSKKEHRLTQHDILDRLVDGRILSTWEMQDRWALSQILGVYFPLERKQYPKRVR